NSSEYKVDGEFLAYEAQVHTNGTMMVTTVSVTIEKGKIVDFNIDALQSTKVQNEETLAWTYTWNAKTKKELGDDYNMVEFGGAISEWYVQAELIEAFWLENGVDAVTTNAETHVIDNVSGVTIKDGGYIALAQEAVQLAKEGKFQSIYCSGTNLYSAHMVVTTKGEIESLMLDTLQMNRASTTSGTFEWNAKTKQELGFEYKMHYGASGAADLTAYQAWLTANNKLEWFQQANLITDEIIENGWSTSAAENIPAGVTISTEDYFVVLADLFAFAGSSVK
ncbi:MAG: hypothetical protein JXC35_01430, partial [Acholeplasmataceae bacterium]|nr:hypothetical protein [Acholeplasmataceae bacterium]